MPIRPPQCVLLLSWGVGALASGGLAQTDVGEFHVLSVELESHTGRARSLSTDGIVLLDELDLPRLRPWSEVLVALRPRRDGFSPPAQIVPTPELVGWAVLADGQRHRVWPTPPESANPDVLDVTLQDGTQWGIPLEHLRALVFFDSPGTDGPRLDDTVRLANGDAISGFIETIASDVIVDSTRVPLDRVASISLANPPEPATHTLVDLADGTVLAAGAIAPADAGRVAISVVLAGPEGETSQPTIHVNPEDILAVRPANPSARLLPMASLPLIEVTPLAGRRWSPDPEVSPDRAPAALRPIAYPGPMEAVYQLPPGATHFHARATLDRAQWADVTVRLLVETPGGDRTPLAQAPLDQDRPEAALIARIPDNAVRLVLRIEPGDRGPIQDRVTLTDALLVVARD
ncbi:MAG: hypothetical protein ACF8Q5_12240 [Phycisphaerales bacterium JB040]